MRRIACFNRRLWLMRRCTIPCPRMRPPPAMVAEIEELANRLDVSSSTLLRGWIQQGLAAQHDTTVAGALDQLAADLQRLRQMVA